MAIAVTGGFWFGNHTEQSVIPKTDGIVLHPSQQIKDFMLKDHELRDFSTTNLLGKWHLMFFGYTHCPDICPTTLHTLKIAYEKMSDADREMISVVFVSVDPLRDTPEVLGEYLHYFNDDFIGVTANDETLKNFTQQLGVTYMKSETVKENSVKNILDVRDNNYLMTHSSRILVINPRAELQAYLRSPRDPQNLLDSVHKIQSFYDNIPLAK